uniref:Calmodulin n=1 Tax=Plectus sambesii TaxID=2011161 RepID=A0A914XQ20_9BILA
MRSSRQLSVLIFAVIYDVVSRHVCLASPTPLTRNEAILDQDKGIVSVIKSANEPNDSRTIKITLQQLLAFTRGHVPSDVIEESYSLADLDKDGLLDQKEADLAAAIATQLTEKKISRAISAADIVADGLLDVGEAQKAVEHIRINGMDSAFIDDHFRQADQNGDEHLSPD